MKGPGEASFRKSHWSELQITERGWYHCWPMVLIYLPPINGSPTQNYASKRYTVDTLITCKPVFGGQAVNDISFPSLKFLLLFMNAITVSLYRFNTEITDYL